MTTPLDLLVAIERALGVEALRWLLAWARVAPVVALVPAFGMRAIAAPVRVVLGLALAASVLPALSVPPDGAVTAMALAGEVARGVPVAVGASLVLWAGLMVGNLADELRRTQEQARLPVVFGEGSPLGVLLALAVAVAFLGGGGPVVVVRALRRAAEVDGPLLLVVAARVAAAIEVAVAVGGPLLVTSVVVEVAAAFVARAARPAQVAALVSPLRALLLLGATAAFADRLLEGLLLAAGP